jgi:hypothetical protein
MRFRCVDARNDAAAAEQRTDVRGDRVCKGSRERCSNSCAPTGRNTALPEVRSRDRLRVYRITGMANCHTAIAAATRVVRHLLAKCRGAGRSQPPRSDLPPPSLARMDFTCVLTVSSRQHSAAAIFLLLSAWDQMSGDGFLPDCQRLSFHSLGHSARNQWRNRNSTAVHGANTTYQNLKTTSEQ